MFNEFKSLLWLRWRYLLATKVILFVCVLTPFLDFYLLSLWEVARQDTYFLNMALSMIYSLTAGCFITMMVGEEKEKNNLKTLRLSGVRDSLYLLSVIFFPVLFSFISASILPLVFGTTFGSWLIYFGVIGTTILTFIFLNLTIALLAKSQQQAAGISMFILMLATFLPAFAPLHPMLKQLTYLSFVGANAEFLTSLVDYQLVSWSFAAQLVWLVGLILTSVWAYRRTIILGH